jgi:hypothetical protein
LIHLFCWFYTDASPTDFAAGGGGFTFFALRGAKYFSTVLVMFAVRIFCLSSGMSQTPLTWSKKYRWSKTLKWNGLAPNTGPIMPNTSSTDTPIVVNLSPAEKAAILAKAAELAALLTWTIGLSDADRKAMFKLGDKSVGFDQKVAAYMTSRPDLVPGYVDMAQLAQNRTARVDVGDILRVVGDIWQRLSDTELKLGNQVFKPELAFYHSAQEAAKHGVNGAQGIVDDLKVRFAGQGQRTTPATTTSKTTP